MFVRAANPIWYMVDHVGQPLNDEYYAFFLTNTLPYIPQNVYRDPQGMTVWTGNVLQFEPSGTLPNNLYFDPDLVYRIEIRHGNSQSDELIWEINNFVPGQGVTPESILGLFVADNQISNPQFSLLNFVSPYTITVAGTYPIAPGWDLVLTGAGTTTLTQLVFSGNENVITNPPYALKINNNGWTESYLRQRFNQNGALWANGAVAMSLTGRAEVTSQTVSMIYSPSSPGVPELVASSLLGTGDYEVLQGAIDLPASVNTTFSDDAYVDVIIQLPPTGIVDLTNIQVLGQTDALPTDFNPNTDVPSYQQQTQERELDYLFHNYYDDAVTRPKKSLLVGWNFSLNPFQFNTPVVTAQSSQTVYIADQTILYQETNNNISTGKAANTQRQGLQVGPTGSSTNTRFALIQYIDPKTIRPYWSYVLSSLARARIFTSVGTEIRLKMRLIYRTDLPPSISATEPIASWPLGDDPVFAAGWNEIIPQNDPDYLLQNNYEDDNLTHNAYPAYSFEGLQLPNSSADNMTLGIVVYTMDRMAVSSGDFIVFDKISLMPTPHACDADPQTFDESLRECEFYYEKSYIQGALPGSITNTGIRSASMRIISNTLYFSSFSLIFNSEKRVPPTLTFYSSDGTINTVQSGILVDGLFSPATAGNPADYSDSIWNQVGATGKSVFMECTDTTTARFVGNPTVGNEGILLYQYVADARLGV